MTEADLEAGRVYPTLTNIKEVSFQIALRVAQIAYLQGIATVMPEPEDKHSLIRSVLYSPDYKSYLPQTYDYPLGHEEEFEDDVECWLTHACMDRKSFRSAKKISRGENLIIGQSI